MTKKQKRKLAHMVGDAPDLFGDEKKPTKWDFHEAQQAALMVAEVFDWYVMDGRAVFVTPKLRARAEKVSAQLHQLYQEIGPYFDAANRKKKNKKKEKKS